MEGGIERGREGLREGGSEERNNVQRVSFARENFRREFRTSVAIRGSFFPFSSN